MDDPKATLQLGGLSGRQGGFLFAALLGARPGLRVSVMALACLYFLNEKL
jgi:hypothetical protein